jgi:putative chitinase
MLTLEIMQRCWPHGDQHIPGLIEGIVATHDQVFRKYGLITDNDHISRITVAHAMGQFSEECGCGLEMLENMNYSKEGLLRIFPRHFTKSMAERCQHNPKIIACIAYGGRMGNKPPPSLDGYNRRGTGLSQLTGEALWQECQDKLKARGTDLDIMGNPELLLDPNHTLEIAICDYVDVCGCLPHAQNDDTLGETKTLNGGTNGLDERKHQIGLWKHELGV